MNIIIIIKYIFSIQNWDFKMGGKKVPHYTLFLHTSVLKTEIKMYGL